MKQHADPILKVLIVFALILVGVVLFSTTAFGVGTSSDFSTFNATITGTAISAKVSYVGGSGLCDDGGVEDFIDSFYIPSFDASYTGVTYFTEINTDYPAQFLEADLPQNVDLCFWYYTSSWQTDTETPFQYTTATPTPTPDSCPDASGSYDPYVCVTADGELTRVGVFSLSILIFLLSAWFAFDIYSSRHGF